MSYLCLLILLPNSKMYSVLNIYTLLYTEVLSIIYMIRRRLSFWIYW